MVGDSWKNDVLGPLSVGMRAVWLNRHGLHRPNGASTDTCDAPEMQYLMDVLPYVLPGSGVPRS